MRLRLSNEPSNSRRGQLNRIDWHKIVKGLIVAMAGAGLCYVADDLMEMVTHKNFGIWAPVVTALLGVLVNAGRKWLTDYQNNGEP